MSDLIPDPLYPHARVTADELAQMPPNMTPAEALPWARISRAALYRAINSGEIEACRLGRNLRIPTRRFLAQLGVLDD